MKNLIIGAWVFWLYAALKLWRGWKETIVIEKDKEAFWRASYINQARLHSGYHYPRSKLTAEQSIKYFIKFYEDFRFAINDSFKQIYAISSTDSKVNATEYKDFCKYFNIKCDEIDSSLYFKNGSVEKAFDTKEYSFDAVKIRDYFLSEIEKLGNVKILYNEDITKVEKSDDDFLITLKSGKEIKTKNVLNTTYASSNQIIKRFWFDNLFDVKYELCEVIFCEVNDIIKNVGLTVMDWPFFSVMPFWLRWFHSITSVQHTPHQTSYNKLPKFDCQIKSNVCTEDSLDNCNLCKYRPETARNQMIELAYRYLNDEIKMKYISSIFTPKIILSAAEKDDARPTLIREFWEEWWPKLYSVLSWKLNTIYELDEVIDKFS